MPEIFTREPSLEPESNDAERELGGIKAEKYVGEFLECQEALVEKIELTQKGGDNDQHQIDAFVTLKGELPCAVDFTGAKGEKLEQKQKRENVLSFVTRYDEVVHKSVSPPMPHFIIDGIDVKQWIDWGREADINYIPIIDVMGEKHQQKEYRFILGKIWEQINRLLKEGSKADRSRIRPYHHLITEEYKRLLSEKELKVLGIN